MGKNQTKSQIILYQTEDGQTKIQVKMEDGTVWLTQDQTMRKFGISEFSTKPTN